jgi:CheY-like chemotaxis protein
MKPLALVVYERVMPGGQLANRLQDLGYRVQNLTRPADLLDTARSETPLLVFLDLATPGEVLTALRALKAEPATVHLPVIAFAPEKSESLLAEALTAGAILAVADTAVVNHLPQLIDQALHLE